MADLEPPMTLQLETYKLLRAEIDHHCKAFDTYAISAVAATAAAWGWLLTHSDAIKDHRWFYLAPAFCALLFGFRILAIMRAVTEIGGHLAKIEKEFGLDENSGWECYCKAERLKSEQELQIRTSGLLGLWQWGFWIILCGLNLIAAFSFLGWSCGSESKKQGVQSSEVQKQEGSGVR